jgi:alcohol dehydrogenase class IV
MLRGEVSEIPNLLPTVAVPTTLAGAEFTLGGAYTLEGHKLFFAGPGLPARLSAYTPSSSPYTRALGAAATAALTRWLPARAAGSTAPEVLSGLADGAVLGALAFVSGGGGVHHAICHVLGGVFGIPHGVANAVVLSYALAANESHSREVQADLAAVMGAELARRNIDGGRNLAENVRALRTVVHQPSTLRDLGVAEESIGSIADEVLEREPTLVTNPRPVTRELLVQILTAAWRGDLALAAA